MKKIYKYPLALTDHQTIELPIGANILDVQLQRQQIQLWAEVNPGAQVHYVDIVIVGTGHSVPNTGLTYIATVQTGDCVWHVYHGGVLS